LTGRWTGSLPRHLGPGAATAIYIGVILGSGIFVAPSVVSATGAGPAGSSLLWLLGAVVAVSGASCYAECAARLPHSGGFFVFHREAFGPAVAFVGGWAAIFVTYPASIAAIALVLASYLRELTGLDIADRAVAAFAILLAAAVNVAGLKTGPRAQVAITAAKVSALAIVAAAALFAGGAAPAAPAPREVPQGAWLAAAVLVLWTYEGWSDVTLLAGEVREPGRHLGRAVLVGTAILFVTYALVQAAVDAVLPDASSSTRPVADAAAAAFGPGGGRLVAGLVVLSTLGSIQAVILTVSRLGYAMSREGAFVPWFGALHPTLGTPVRATAAMTAASLVYLASSSFREIVTYFTFSVWIFYGLTAVAVLLLRRRGVGDPPAWRAPLGVVPSAIVLVTGALMSGQLVRQRPRDALVGAAVLLASLPVYAWVRRRVTSPGAASRPR
jgi:APA family basic amino acid/polyamine antiporter